MKVLGNKGPFEKASHFEVETHKYVWLYGVEQQILIDSLQTVIRLFRNKDKTYEIATAYSFIKECFWFKAGWLVRVRVGDEDKPQHFFDEIEMVTYGGGLNFEHLDEVEAGVDCDFEVVKLHQV